MAGLALFTDDLPAKDFLWCRPLRSNIACGRVRFVGVPTLPKGYYWVDAKDIVKENVVNIIFSDWPVFAEGKINYYGETIGLLVGPDKAMLEELAKLVQVTYDVAEPRYAFTKSGIHKEFKKGNMDEVEKDYDYKLEETFETGYQEQVYLETQGMIMWMDGDKITIKASMQCPFYIKNAVVRTLGCDPSKVRVIQPAVGGAFGGKEHYPSMMAAQMATAMMKIKKPLKMVFDRSEDLMYTTKRHPSKSTYTGYIKDGKLVGVRAHVRLNGGAYKGCSGVVLSRALIAVVHSP